MKHYLAAVPPVASGGKTPLCHYIGKRTRGPTFKCYFSLVASHVGRCRRGGAEFSDTVEMAA